MKIVHAMWERKNLGVNAYEIFLEPQDTLEQFKLTEQSLIEEGGEYFAVKTTVNRGDLLFGLPKLGYTFVETLFRVAIEREDYHVPQSVARFDRELTIARRVTAQEQEAVFRRIREGVFKSDRISLDPYFPTEMTANRYINWIGQMLGQGGMLYEMLRRGEPVGVFIIKRIDAQTVDPVLMGLYQEDQNRGLGTLLHKKTLDACFAQECARITSTFVSNNAKILRVYANVGAAITDVLYTYVKHVDA
ncbi:MAG: GNAT family N-acetyltransferase [Bacillota bacterium]